MTTKLSLRRTEELLLSPGDYEVSAFAAQLRATTEVLREMMETLKSRGTHPMWCDARRNGRYCSCGLAAALSKIEE
jgi:hypothetical protein